MSSLRTGRVSKIALWDMAEMLSFTARCRSRLQRVSRNPDSPARGATLLELLAVIVILGIVTGMVSLSIAPGESRRMDEEVDRLAALFRLANDEARVSGRPIVWRADTDGYRFVQSDEVRGESNKDDPLRPRAWPFDVRLVDAPEIVFGREPLMDPARVYIATQTREMAVDVDAFGQLKAVP